MSSYARLFIFTALIALIATASARPIIKNTARPVSYGLITSSSDTRHPTTDTLSLPATFKWDSAKQGAFVMSLCADKRGRLFVGTEDMGVWMYDAALPAGKAWRQFTTKDGLGDNNGYALCCDSLGRIWAGNLNHGVSVFNGEKWKNYDVLTGPIGSRVFALAVNPVNGDVWGATEAGLFRYTTRGESRESRVQSRETRAQHVGTRREAGVANQESRVQKKGTRKTLSSLKTRPTLDSGLSTLYLSLWRYFTRADGLPSDQANCLAFNRKGVLYVGTQCEGLAIGDAMLEHPVWRNVRGVDKLPLQASGEGLPTNLINCVLITKENKIYVGTTTGLAWSDNDGKTFKYLRGKDWLDKVNGLYPSGQKPLDLPVPNNLLAEDYITSLADARKDVIIGHRDKQIEIRANEEDAPLFPVVGNSAKYCTALIYSHGAVLGATYRDGVSFSPGEGNTSPGIHPTRLSHTAFAFPSPAPPPTISVLEKMTASLRKLPADPMPVASYLGEDWVTQGDYVGHYGRQFTTLCATSAPDSHVFGGNPHYQVSGQMGPHHTENDLLRSWMHWATTDNKKSLYDQFIGHRRQAEWDDHGETYPATYDGPDIWIKVEINEPKVQSISLYFMNKDGHDGDNSYRDYMLEVRKAPVNSTFSYDLPVIARGRVVNFWGGVYKSFLVEGPGKYFVTLRRNYSKNAIISAVLLDKLLGPAFFTDNTDLAWMPGVFYLPPNPDPPKPLDEHALEKALAAKASGKPLSLTPPLPTPAEMEVRKIVSSARGLWNQLDRSLDMKGIAVIQRQEGILAYRTIINQKGTEILAANWRWNLHLWTSDDRSRFEEVTKKAYESLMLKRPELNNNKR